MVNLSYIDTECFEDESIFNQTYKNLSEERRKKIDFYYFSKDRCLSMGAGYLLDVALKKLGLSENELEIYLGENGKPYIKDSPCFFNLSHSGKFAICAISDKEIGADIEYIKKPDIALMKRVCRTSELNYLRTLEDDLLASTFTKLWTIKESYMKYLGSGLTIDPLSLEIDFGNPCSIIKDDIKSDVVFKTYTLSHYQITLCNQAGNFPIIPCLIDIKI